MYILKGEARNSLPPKSTSPNLDQLQDKEGIIHQLSELREESSNP